MPTCSWSAGPWVRAGAGDYWLASQVLVAALLFANAAGQMALARLPALADDPDRFQPCRQPSRSRAFCGSPCRAAAAVGLAGSPAPAGSVRRRACRRVTALLWLLPWFVLQHPTTVLQAALTAGGRETAVLRANAIALVVLLPALGLAAATSSLAAFALARSVAEATRLVGAFRLAALPFGTHRRGLRPRSSHMACRPASRPSRRR